MSPFFTGGERIREIIEKARKRRKEIRKEILRDLLMEICSEKCKKNQTQKTEGALMKKPSDLLIYYGWLSGFNQYWDNEKVAQDMARYDLLVFGDGVQDPGHGDYANSQVIIPRIKELNPDALIFGYVTANQNLSDFKTKADGWEAMIVDGIFMDEAGYDFGVKRTDLNDRILHVKSFDEAYLCFVNAWNMDHVVGTENDPSFPNSTFNPDEYESLLEEDDWYLLESFVVNTAAYSGNNGYASKSDVVARGDKATYLRGLEPINLAAVNIIDNSDANGQALFDFCQRAALAYNLNANGSSDTSYGASSGKVNFWTRNERNEDEDDDCPSVTEDVNDSDVLLAYTQKKKISLDFSAGQQTSSVETW